MQVAAAHIVRDFHPSEFLGMLGLCGAIITFVQVRLSLALFVQVRYINSLFIHSPFTIYISFWKTWKVDSQNEKKVT